MELPNYYSILGIDSFANLDEIKRAYRRLALKYHPDINKSPHAHEKFVLINEAYQILSNDESRRIYDLKFENNQYKTTEPEYSSEDDLIKNMQHRARRKSNEYTRMSFTEFREELLRTMGKVGSTAFWSLIKAVAIVICLAGFFRIIMGIYYFDTHFLITGSIFIIITVVVFITSHKIRNL